MNKVPLVIERLRPQLLTIVNHLREQFGVAVQVCDSTGRVLLASDHQCSSCPNNWPSLLTNDGQLDPAPSCPSGSAIQTLPIRRGNDLFGAVIACGPSTPSTERAHLLQTLVDLIVESTSNDREIESLASELVLRYEEIELLYEIDQNIPLRSYTANVIEYVARKALDVVDCPCLAWVSQPHAGEPADCRLFWKDPAPAAPLLRLDAEQIARSLADRCSKTRETVTVADIPADPDFTLLQADFVSAISMPVRVENDFYGCFVGLKRQGTQFVSYELKLLTALSRKSAFVLRDSRLFEDLDSLFFNLIKLIINTIESKDEYTKGHSQRVRAFTVRLAQLLGLSKGEIEILNLSGLLHDIGKQGIPDAILKKDGRLTDDERAMINTHPTRGVNLIKHIRQFERCLPCIQHHHERIDGKGYPDGLKGDQIPLGARIIAVADTYDALTSDRCYRPRFTNDRALDIIREVAGTQLDARIAQLLIDHRDEFLNDIQPRLNVQPETELVITDSPKETTH